ncbi:MAG: hypothetical protein JSV86_20710 [Gemmatimonadota bacterium]|nr:MAG: hypothetical protein JSV86_20710 [Gemmatimonadota bacterium]
MHRRAPLILSLALLLAAPPALGQIRDPELQSYSFVSGIGLGAGLWVNPGAAGFNRAVHLLGHITIDRPEGEGWGTGQYTVGLHSRVIAFGYRHDEFESGTYGRGDAYTVAVGLAQGRNGIGVSRTWRTVGEAEGSWEIGYVSHAASGASLGLVWRDIRSPTVRDTVRHERLVGAISYRLADSPITLSVQGDYRLDGGKFNAFRIGGSFQIVGTLDAMALAEWNGDGDFEALRLGALVRGERTTLFGGAGLDAGGDARSASAGLAFRSPHR